MECAGMLQATVEARELRTSINSPLPLPARPPNLIGRLQCDGFLT